MATNECPMKKFPRVSTMLVLTVVGVFAARWLGWIGW